MKHLIIATLLATTSMTSAYAQEAEESVETEEEVSYARGWVVTSHPVEPTNLNMMNSYVAKWVDEDSNALNTDYLYKIETSEGLNPAFRAFQKRTGYLNIKEGGVYQFNMFVGFPEMTSFTDKQVRKFGPEFKCSVELNIEGESIIDKQVFDITTYEAEVNSDISHIQKNFITEKIEIDPGLYEASWTYGCVDDLSKLNGSRGFGQKNLENYFNTFGANSRNLSANNEEYLSNRDDRFGVQFNLTYSLNDSELKEFGEDNIVHEAENLPAKGLRKLSNKQESNLKDTFSNGGVVSGYLLTHTPFEFRKESKIYDLEVKEPKWGNLQIASLPYEFQRYGGLMVQVYESNYVVKESGTHVISLGISENKNRYDSYTCFSKIKLNDDITFISNEVLNDYEFRGKFPLKDTSMAVSTQDGVQSFSFAEANLDEGVYQIRIEKYCRKVSNTVIYTVGNGKGSEDAITEPYIQGENRISEVNGFQSEEEVLDAEFQIFVRTPSEDRMRPAKPEEFVLIDRVSE